MPIKIIIIYFAAVILRKAFFDFPMRLIGTSFDTSDIMIIENPVATVFTQLIKDIGHIPKPDGINVTAKTSTRKVIKNVTGMR